MPDSTEKTWAELKVGSAEDLAAIFRQIESELAADLAAAAGPVELRATRDRWLARKGGRLTRIKDQWLAAAPKEWKRALGQSYNALAQKVETQLAEARQRLAAAEGAVLLRSEEVDVTLPGRRLATGPAHPVLQVMDRMVDIFVRLGYSVASGPEIETAYYNFEALNIPADHPARDDQDTFYLAAPEGELLLRTHTSPVQIRAMRAQAPPLRVVAPGRVYRHDAPDASHSPMFHQLEGLAVDENLTLGDLKGTLDHFAREMFGASAKTRFRPSYFPFTEPSAEMDVSCILCAGAGCRACKQSGWIEVLGCGMVHPALYSFAGQDAGRWSGFAFGMGVERTAMLFFGVDDLQRFYSGDLRFLEQFAG